jgi:hypothetical protein
VWIGTLYWIGAQVMMEIYANHIDSAGLVILDLNLKVAQCYHIADFNYRME